MAIEKTTFTGTNGQAATTGNTDTAALSTSGGTLTFDSQWSPRGVVALKATATAVSGSVYARQALGSASSALAYEMPVKPLAWPDSADDSILRLASNSAGTRNIEVTVFADGSLGVRNAPFTVAWRSAAALMTIGTGCIVSVFCETGDTAGKFRIVVYEEDETTVRVDSGMLTSQNTGTAAMDSTRTLSAKAGTSARTSQYLFGEPRWDMAATDIMPTLAEEPHHPAHFAVNGVAVPVNIHLAVAGAAVQII